MTALSKSYDNVDEMFDDMHGRSIARLYHGQYHNPWYGVKGFVNQVKRIPNNAKMIWQRGWNGYSDADVYGHLGLYLASWMPRAVQDLRENAHGHPGGLTPEEWDEILKEIQVGFYAARHLDGSRGLSDAERERYETAFKRGMKLLTKWYFHLWD